MTTATLNLDKPNAYHPKLHLFAVWMVVLTFILIASGGNVTSHGAGLAVPDWPTTFEYNMFTYPIYFWTGGVFHEHVHRLKGTLIGLMTIIMTVWLWRSQPHRPWLRRVGVLLLVLVLIQGGLGGFRVIFATGDFTGVGGDVSAQRINETLATTLAIIHGIVGQLFLCLTVLCAAATSHWWSARDQWVVSHDVVTTQPSASSNHPQATRQSTGDNKVAQGVPTSAKVVAVAFLSAVIVQLALGAGVRHTKSALAVPDFPLNYGGIAPPITQADLDHAIEHMSDQYFVDHYQTGMVLDHYTLAQVWVAYGHRVWATVVVILGLMLIVQVGRLYGRQPLVSRAVLGLLVMLLLQVMLGALVIWSLRFPYISTIHQAVGAAILALSFVIYLRICRIPPKWVYVPASLTAKAQPGATSVPNMSDTTMATS